MSNRMPMVNSTMRKEISVIFRDYVNPVFTKNLVTITDLKTSADLQHCYIYISVLGKGKSVEKIIFYLKANTNKFHQILRKRLTMKYIPKLYWISDGTPAKAQYLSDMIDDLDVGDND